MLKFISIATLISVSMLMVTIVGAQTAIKPSVVVGDVASVGDNKIIVNSKTGAVEVIVTDKTAFKRVSAINPNLQAAKDGTVAEIGVGDRLTVTGILSADGKSLPARTVYFITKADIAEKNAKETAEWRQRGVAGKVTNVNLQTGQLTVEVRGLTGSTNTVITPKEGAQFLKYAPDSIRFDEAVSSSLAEVKPGDMLRALGDKSADGTSFAAERVITGAFQTIAGTVTSIDTEKNEVVIKNLQDNKPMTVVISNITVIKRFPQEMAERLAGAQRMMGGGARPVGGQQGTRPGAPGGGRPGMGGAGGAGIDDMIERFPKISASDLTVGDMIAFSSSKNGNMDRVKAIKILAGVEPFLRMAQASGGRRGQGVDGGFTIPGLDSMEP